MISNIIKITKNISNKNRLICDKIFFHSQPNVFHNVLSIRNGTDHREAFATIRLWEGIDNDINR